MKKALFLANVVLCLATLACGVARAQSVANVVTNASLDSLNVALQAAQTNGGNVLIDVDGTFTLGSTLNITTNILLQAATNRTVAISGGNAVRVFNVSQNAVLTLINLSVINGLSPAGAGIYNDGGTVVALQCLFTGNIATNKVGTAGRVGNDGNINGGNGGSGGSAIGGAVYTSGNFAVYSSVFSNNAAWGGDGGAGGNGDTNSDTFGANGGDGGNGGSASGGAIYIAGGTNDIGWCFFALNSAGAGFGGIPGNAGPGGIPGNGGKGGAGNSAFGAGIYNAGVIRITNSVFLNNSAYGGSSSGVQPYSDGSSRSASVGGAALGGALYNMGQVAMTNCTVVGNLCQGGAGGNIASSAPVKAGDGGNACGGGLAMVGATSVATLVNCTFATNALYGGTNGVNSNTSYNGATGRVQGGNLFRSAGVLTVRNSILDQGAGQNSYGGVTDGGYNISSDSSCKFTAPGSSNSLSPMLGTALEWTTPPTNSPFAILLPGRSAVVTLHSLPSIVGLWPQPGSPAINAIPDDGDYPPIDQRDIARPQGSGVDIGAVEVEADLLTPSVIAQFINGTNPAAQVTFSVKTGSDITLSVNAGGQAPLSYQWTVDGLAIHGATNSSLSIFSAQSGESGSYGVTISNPLGTTDSTNLDVQILDPLASSGFSINFAVTTTVEVSSNVVMDTTNFVITTVAQPVTTNVVQVLTNSYVFTNQFGLIESTNIVITNIVSVPIATNYTYFTNSTEVLTTNRLDYPFVLVVPTNSTVISISPLLVTNQVAVPTDNSITNAISANASNDISIAVITSGSDPLSYQWYFNSALLTDQIYNFLTISNVQSTNAGSYSVVASNAVSVITNRFVLSVHSPTRIIQQPVDQKVLSGSDVVLGVAAAGEAPIHYIWVWNNQPVNTTKSTYVIKNLQAPATNSYYVIVTNRYSSVTSLTAQVTVWNPLKIIAQAPPKLSLKAGTNVTLSVAVTSDVGSPTYQWFHNSSAMPGQTNSDLTLVNIQSASAGLYRVVVRDAVSQATSSNTVLTIGAPPTITRQPQSRILTNGLPATLQVAAKDSGPVSYQWLHDGNPIAQGTSSNYTINLPQTSDVGAYSVIVSGTNGSVESAKVNLAFRVKISSAFANQTVAAGSNVVLSVQADGQPVQYQWYRNNVALAGQTTASLSFPAVRKTDAAQYKVVVANPLTSASASATLKVLDLPTIALVAKSVTNVFGSALTLNAAAHGDGPMTYQWQFQGNNIPGATRASFTIPKVSSTNAGLYSIVVFNPVGQVSATLATVNVIPPPPVIRTPALKRVSTNQLMVTGTVGPGAGVNQVVLSVNNQPVNATSADGWRTWSVPITLKLGTNFILATAQAPYGTNSAPGAQYFYKASYSPDPYAANTGVYQGLFFDPSSPLQTSSGALNLSVMSMGIFSGKVLQGTNVYPFSGQFDTSGLASVTSGTSTFAVQLDLAGSPTNQLLGTISGDDWADSPLQLNRVVSSSAKPAAMPGKYTLVVPGQTDSDGDGFATLQVAKSGAIGAVGMLADGSAISGAGTVCSGGQWPMYFPANGGQGSLFGWLTFDATTNLTGSATWISPAGDLFPNGVTQTTDVLASPYSAPAKGLPAVELPVGTISLNGGNLVDAPFTAGVSLSTNGVFTVDSTSLILRLNPTNGMVTGSFRDTNSATLDPVYGIILKDQKTVRGFFIGPSQSGKVTAE